jgi:hypothetical protein
MVTPETPGIAVRDVVHIERSGPDLRRGGRAAGVSVAHAGALMLLPDEPPPDCKSGGGKDCCDAN